VFCLLGTLALEYCLTTIADGEKLGTESMGRFVALVSGLPAVILLPLATVYWLRYLAVVAAASAEGDSRPPRPPDRNFDGFFTALASWLVWLALGVGLGLAPLGGYSLATMKGLSWNPAVAMALGGLGFAYALMAFMMVFLHDNPLAANPVAVLAAIARVALSFFGLCLSTAATLALIALAFAAAFALRPYHFALYVVVSLAAWFLAGWLSIVAMHTLGSYYRRHKRRFDA
jgi:hypothetical protein